MFKYVFRRRFCFDIYQSIQNLRRKLFEIYMAHQQTLQGQIDHRLKQQINEKKLAMGLKIESTQKASYQTEEEYEMSR